jgi:hypothetical protein
MHPAGTPARRHVIPSCVQRHIRCDLDRDATVPADPKRATPIATPAVCIAPPQGFAHVRDDLPAVYRVDVLFRDFERAFRREDDAPLPLPHRFATAFLPCSERSSGDRRDRYFRFAGSGVTMTISSGLSTSTRKCVPPLDHARPNMISSMSAALPIVTSCSVFVPCGACARNCVSTSMTRPFQSPTATVARLFGIVLSPC